MNLPKLRQILLILVIVLLPTQLGLHFWPDWAIINGRRIDYFAPTLYLTDILIILLFFVVVASKAKQSVSTMYNRLPRRPWLLAMTKKYLLGYCVTGLLVLLVLLNIYFSYSPFVSAYKWLKVLEFGFLFFYLRRTTRSDKFLFIPILLSVFYESLLAIWQFVSQSSVGGLWYFLGERSYTITTPGIATVQFSDQQLLRSYGTFSHPNVLGGFLAIVLPLLLLSFWRNKVTRSQASSHSELESSKKTDPSGKASSLLIASLQDDKLWKLFNWAILFLGYFALLLTFSRTAIIIGLIFSVAVVFRHMKLARKSVVLLGLALIPFLVFFLPLINLGTEAESFSVRSQLNDIAIREWVKSPLIGTGLGTSPLYTLTTNYQLRTTNYSLVGQPIHNIYLLLLSETGLVGLIGFIGLLIYWFTRKPLVPRAYTLGAMLFLGLFDHYFLTSQQGQLLLVFMLTSIL